MEDSLNEDSWVWVVIQDPDRSEQLLGQFEKENEISFIPAFYEKEEALECYELLSRDKTLKYEIQALLYGDLIKYTKDNDFMIFFLNGEGKILERIKP